MSCAPIAMFFALRTKSIELTQQSAVSASGGAFTYEIPTQSIVTFAGTHAPAITSGSEVGTTFGPMVISIANADEVGGIVRTPHTFPTRHGRIRTQRPGLYATLDGF
jgi:hypothetical protein